MSDCRVASLYGTAPQHKLQRTAHTIAEAPNI